MNIECQYDNIDISFKLYQYEYIIILNIINISNIDIGISYYIYIYMRIGFLHNILIEILILIKLRTR